MKGDRESEKKERGRNTGQYFGKPTGSATGNPGTTALRRNSEGIISDSDVFPGSNNNSSYLFMANRVECENANDSKFETIKLEDEKRMTDVKVI